MSVAFLKKSGSKGCVGKEQDDKRGMLKITDTQLNVNASRPLVYAKFIIFHAPDWCVQPKIFYKTVLWWIFFLP